MIVYLVMSAHRKTTPRPSSRDSDHPVTGKAVSQHGQCDHWSGSLGDTVGSELSGRVTDSQLSDRVTDYQLSGRVTDTRLSDRVTDTQLYDSNRHSTQQTLNCLTEQQTLNCMTATDTQLSGRVTDTRLSGRVTDTQLYDSNRHSTPNTARKELLKLKKVIHPKSRKTQALAKQVKKVSAREKTKLVHHMKQNLLGEKLLWFRDNLEPEAAVYSPRLVVQLIDK
uniref:Uncharacterized protein n=1 Tax=Timema douglasi TaxID=61478 RepID=A0A7R8VX32_TIMDO|nr:unnamed protein product [Timema douglasi]